MTAQVIVPDAVWLDRAVHLFRGTTSDPAFLTVPGARALVAVEGQFVLGWAWGYHLPRPDSSSMLYVHEVDVLAEHRRTGIGRELLAGMLEAGREAGAWKAVVVASADNLSARGLYESMGGLPSDDGHAVTYWFPLR